MAEYISREAAVEKLTFLCELREIVCNPDDEFLRGLKNALNAVKSNEIIPSADVQSVKHGYWEEETRVLKCSVCGEYAPMNYLGQNCIDSRYCPWCGAKMDAEPDEPWQSE